MPQIFLCGTFSLQKIFKIFSQISIFIKNNTIIVFKHSFSKRNLKDFDNYYQF